MLLTLTFSYGVMQTHPSPHENTKQRNPDLKDLEASNVQNTDKVLSRQLRIQLLVDASDHPQEQLFINRFGKGIHSVVNLLGKDH